MEGCIFCKIISGEVPGERISENEDFIAIRDVNPKAPVHALVIPREHIRSLNEIERWRNGQGHELLTFIVRISEILGIRDTGYRVTTNVGRDARQEVPHLHVHVLGGGDLGEFS